uniref:ATP synthase F0 subunit 8 n=1 Tax=Theopompa sp. FY-2016a TaxID=1849000 RepID=A0A172QHH7_9NEOP|nr:ATP synthase F0 subunit 8 [Theopompa sp. FY-2016a]
MPQMMPLNWLSLFIFFSSLLMMYSIMNYYTSIKSYPTSKSQKLTHKIHLWKW